jgi:hypothetical protein
METEAIENFISEKIGQHWKALAPPIECSGRRRAQIITGNGLSA